MFNGAFEDRELKNIMVQHTTTNSLINKNMKNVYINCLFNYGGNNYSGTNAYRKKNNLKRQNHLGQSGHQPNRTRNTSY